MLRLTLALLLALPLVALAQKPGKDAARTDGEVGEADDGKRVSLAFDPGSHSRPISAVGFSKDGRKLITVGWDYSVRVWSTTTGEQLDILRLPPYGRDNGADATRWPIAAVSADGRYVAVGGDAKLVWEAGKPARCQLVIVDVETKKCRRAVSELDADHTTTIKSLAFSADGKRLLFATGGKEVTAKVIDDVPGFMAGDAPAKPSTVVTGLKRDLLDVGLSPSGNKVVLGELGGLLHSWDISGTDPKKWKKVASLDRNGRTQGFAWTADEGRVVRGWQGGAGTANRGFEFLTPDLKVEKTLTQGELSPGFVGTAVVCSMKFLDADRLFVSAHGVLTKGDGGEHGAFGLVVNVKDRTAKRLFVASERGMFTPFGAASGDLAATTTNKGLAATVYRISDGKVVATCGNQDPLTRVVGWADDAKAPAIAWANKESLDPFDSKPSDLTDAFDLTALTPLATVKPEQFHMRVLSADPWRIEHKKDEKAFVKPTVKNTATKTEGVIEGYYRSVTLVPRGNDPPLVATARHDVQLQMGTRAALWSADGKKVTDWFPYFSETRDMAPSPDGRYVVMSTGTHRVSIYRTDGSKFPFLNLAVVNREWVLWTPEGYYAASPGGEKLIGWSVSRGPNALAEFLQADRYAKHFRRPDLIKLALEKGSMKEALAALKTAPPDVESILPPVATLTRVKQDGATVTVKAEARAATKDKPLIAMRVMLDGKPLADGKGVWDPAGPQPASGEFTFDIPAGLHELTVMARTEDGPGVSPGVFVRGPKGDSPQPTLHRLCIGIDEYDDPGLKLGSAVKDAEGLFAALEKHCVGPDNRFGAATGELLVNKNATREKALQALAAIRKKAKPGDLVVVFFAGHGKKQKDEFYLVTREGDTAKSLSGASLSGADLRKELAQMEGRVLLILDACHSAEAVKSFRPATDDLTRTMIDETVGVTVMAAAKSDEEARATKETGGYFTAGLLKGLAAGPGVPFDDYEYQLYVHHLHDVAGREVRRATGGKQNPILIEPWTMPSLVLREVPVR